MVEQLLHHINRHNLCGREDRVLLAVSGGVDSMVMMHLFREAGLRIAIAHCNFRLRGAESDGDEALVRETALAMEIPFHINHFNTREYADTEKISIQMSARDLRYKWFHELISEYRYQFIATAHHLNDSIETFLLNLTRGTGLEGLTGIPVRSGKVIRPMLFATRDMIEAYAVSCGIAWRFDSSNDEKKYYRNLMRSEVIPLLKKINPNFENTFRTTIERLQGGRQAVQYMLDEFRREAVSHEGCVMGIKKEHLLKQPNKTVLLWELLKEFGFNYGQCNDIIGSVRQPGKVFYTGTHRLSVDRELLVLDPKETDQPIHVVVSSDEIHAATGEKHLKFSLVEREHFQIQKDSMLAQLDAALVKFPLEWRTWKPGDQFIPLGMKHHKKISDFLIDEKVPLREKNEITVLVAATGEILWVVGKRIADPFKVTEKTTRVLGIRYWASGIGNQ